MTVESHSTIQEKERKKERWAGLVLYLPRAGEQDYVVTAIWLVSRGVMKMSPN